MFEKTPFYTDPWLLKGSRIEFKSVTKPGTFVALELLDYVVGLSLMLPQGRQRSELLVAREWVSVTPKDDTLVGPQVPVESVVLVKGPGASWTLESHTGLRNDWFLVCNSH